MEKMDAVLRPPPKPPEFLSGSLPPLLPSHHHLCSFKPSRTKNPIPSHKHIPSSLLLSFQNNKSVMRLKTHCFPASNSTGALADRSGAFSDDVTTLRPSRSTSFHASSCAMTSSPPNPLSPPPALPMSCFAFLALQAIPAAALPSHPWSQMATRAAMAFLPMTTPSRVFLASFSTAVAPSLHPPSSKVPTPLSCSAVMLSLSVAGSILLGFPLRPHKSATILFLFFSKPSSAATQSFSNTAMKSLLRLKKTTFKDKMFKAISMNPTPDQVSSWFNTSIILPCLPPSLTHTLASRTSTVKDEVAKVISGELLLSSSASSLPVYSLPSNEALIVGFLDMAQHLSDPDPVQHCCYRLFDVSIPQISLIWNLNYPSDATSSNDRTTVASSKDILLFALNPPDPQ
ncbi:uncharacterized protein G2W53_041648 [Senna tora]|uniref:Uncharacterized protein n=1 Tax=Senna tora TaxID=362788 RepID=A0A834VYY5_9FABA|nr:uncharacterized protein G2W53_041648 [Senna tora]